MTAAARKIADANRRRAMVRRIVRHWRECSADDLAAGLAWYGRAEAHAADIAAGTPFSARQVAAVIAALSPRQSWRANVNAARTMVEHWTADAAGHDVGPVPNVGLRSNVNKAADILNGSDPLDVLGGPKVRAFFANLTGDIDAVTVDAWAVRAATGEDGAHVGTEARYRNVAAAYREAADALGVAPRDLQAAVWVHIRGRAG